MTGRELPPSSPFAGDDGTADPAVAAALDNVGRHAGDGARAWVLLEGDSLGIEVTVRDDGDGAELADLLGASANGRMGVSGSIRGRVEDLGGSVTWTTRPGAGCVVRMTVPRTSLPRDTAPRTSQERR